MYQRPVQLSVIISCTVLFVVLLAGCGGDRTSTLETGNPEIEIVSPPAAHLVRMVTGVAFEPLLGSGVDPHAHELRPSDALRLRTASAVVVLRSEIDGYLVPSSAAILDLSLATCDAASSLRSIGDAGSHYWLDPVAVADCLPGLGTLVERVGLFPTPTVDEGDQDRVDSLRTWISRLRRAGEVQAALRVVDDHPLIEAIASLRGWTYLGPISTQPATAPAPQQWQRLMRARPTHILVEQGHYSASAQRLAARTGARVVEADVFGGTYTSYQALIEGIIARVEGVDEATLADRPHGPGGSLETGGPSPQPARLEVLHEDHPAHE
jgi:hypothetical protein